LWDKNLATDEKFGEERTGFLQGKLESPIPKRLVDKEEKGGSERERVGWDFTR
jgi:hypothetical protein